MAIQANNIDQFLLSHPVLRPGYQVIQLTAEAVCLRRLDHSFVIRGPSAPLVSRLLEAIDGTRDVTQLAEHAQVDLTIVIQILMRLSQAKVIVEREELLETSAKEFGCASLLAQLYLSGQTDYTQAIRTVSHSLSRQVVIVIGSSDLVHLLSTQLSYSGVEQIHTLQPDQLEYTQLEQLAPTFFLHVERANDYRSALQINEMALSLDIPWVSGWLTDLYLNVTHVMLPGENACFECLLLRQQRNYMHFDVDIAYEQFLRNGQPNLSFQESMSSLDHLLVSFMSMRAISFMIGYRPNPPVPRLLEFSPIEMECMHHPVLRLPHCPACGSLNMHPQTYPYLYTSSFDTSIKKETL